MDARTPCLDAAKLAERDRRRALAVAPIQETPHFQAVIQALRENKAMSPFRYLGMVAIPKWPRCHWNVVDGRVARIVTIGDVIDHGMPEIEVPA
ncbi:MULTISPECIES: hypothetical protein [unclassified Aureimonas]|uniref:hypothetical protein n=1 Tax=unclassified Aureimonas TaxID=2615206 RepID=UPI0006F5BEF2|nr:MULTISPECIES: hypothetical protein [unclassified Aureimonas]KQT61193.1 hypothetical protein ASG62_24110 [Aureimonas sp. Leaf427]KQT62962.1 hypothetical protein ASG54_23055 [Aureimonas sp. Leaf460]